MLVESSSQTQPTNLASKEDGISLGWALVPAPLFITLISKGFSFPATLANNSRFSKPVACSTGSPKVTETINDVISNVFNRYFKFFKENT